MKVFGRKLSPLALGKPSSANIKVGSYSGQHNCGYTCYMSERMSRNPFMFKDVKVHTD